MLSNIGSKLHLVIIISAFLIILYLAYIYREIRSFDVQFSKLKHDVEQLKQIEATHQQKAIPQPICVPSSAPQPLINVQTGEFVNPKSVQEDDDQSINSEEMINLIKNIQTLEEDSDHVQESVIAPTNVLDHGKKTLVIEDTESETVNHPVVDMDSEEQEEQESHENDLSKISHEELSKLSNDTLKAYLRDKSVSTKGTKEQLISKIKSLQN